MWIPLSLWRVEDKVVWRGDETVRYSVCRAYRLISSQPCPSVTTSNYTIWKSYGHWKSLQSSVIN
uniref:Uncharacterized protein n=1 Tax=Manihot esculenta TaxID=3983 RepID=A0A2C9U644_MANES